MNHVTTFRPAAGSALALQPVSAELGRALYQAQHDPDGVLRYGVPAAVAAEAVDALDGMRAVRPAGPHAVLEWLKPVAAAVRNPPTEQEAKDRAAAISAACADLPAEAFSTAARRAAVQTCQFFPSAADVRELVMASASDWAARRRALALVARAPVSSGAEPAAPRQAPAPEAAAAVSALVGAFTSEVAEREAAEAAKRPAERGAKPVSAAVLAALRAGLKTGSAAE